jgi:dTDP-4-dehydrorhamnose reductase
MISILVTGANGQLGKCLQDLSNLYNNYDWNFKSSSELNITQEKIVEKIFSTNNFDYVINCAAYTAVDKAESDSDNAFLVNAKGVKILSQACKKYNVKLIHISTDFVFDGIKKTPYTEEDTPNPINIYGASKLKGEEYIKEILKNYTIIRTSWVYSEYGNNFVKTMLKLSRIKDEISVINDQFGSPTYARHLAEFIITKIINGSHTNGIYHYSSDGNISWYEFAKEIFKLNNINIKLNEISSDQYLTAAKRPFFSVLSKKKVESEFKIKIPKWNNILFKNNQDF